MQLVAVGLALGSGRSCCWPGMPALSPQPPSWRRPNSAPVPGRRVAPVLPDKSERASLGHALVWNPDAAVQMALAPLLLCHGMLMLVVGSADEVSSHIERRGMDVRLMLAGPGVKTVAAAHSALLRH